MSVPKDKVLAVLDTKLKGKSLTKNFKESIAAKWAEKIEKEDDIEGYVDDREDLLLEAGAEADRRATEAAAKAKENPAKQEEEKKDDVKVDANTPDWAKALIEQNKKLSEKFESLQAEKVKSSVQDRFKKDERLKGVPEFMFKGRLPEKEEDFDAYADELASDWKTFKEQNKLSEVVKDTPEGGTTKTTSSTKLPEATVEEVKELLNDLNI